MLQRAVAHENVLVEALHRAVEGHRSGKDGRGEEHMQPDAAATVVGHVLVAPRKVLDGHLRKLGDERGVERLYYFPRCLI